MKCVYCEELAEYILDGKSLCKFHFDNKAKSTLDYFDLPDRLQDKNNI